MSEKMTANGIRTMTATAATFYYFALLNGGENVITWLKTALLTVITEKRRLCGCCTW